MADITTQTIRDTFLDNLPENVTREEGEEFWNAWLDRQREGHEPDMPTPPVGFQYAPGEVDEFDYGEPDLEDEQLTEDQKRDMLGCIASMFVGRVRQCFSAVWADGFPRCRHRFPVM